jgi:putative ABC transport system substrate-binding protein
MEGAARALGVQLRLLDARDPTALDQAVAAASREGAGTLVVFGDGGLLQHHSACTAELAVTHRLPTIFGGRAFVEASGFMSYEPSPAEQGHRVAAYVDNLLHGAKASELPLAKAFPQFPAPPPGAVHWRRQCLPLP